MGRSKIIVAIVAATIVLAVASAGASTKSVKNGGFEKPDVGSGFELFSPGQTFAHWTVVGSSGNVAPVSGDFSQGGYTFDAKAGKQWLDLTGTSNTPTGVAQKVKNLNAGSPYTLTFAVGNVVNPGGIFGFASTVNVLVDGSPLMTAVNSDGTGSTTQVWKRFSKTFVPSSSTITISFINGDPGNDTNNGLDAVSLSAAP